MATIKDFDVTVKAYKGNDLVTTFVGNLWGEPEIFRRLLGPDSIVDHYIMENEFSVSLTKDPINWDHPVCCDLCREEAEIRKAKKSTV